MKLDVVIVTHESTRQLPRSLGNLRSGARVVVVDNASTDRSAELAHELGATVVANDVNAGFAAGANQGAAMGSGEAILFLNPDASIDTGSIDRMVLALEQHDDLAIVSPRIRYDGGLEQHVYWPFPTSAGAWREALGLHRLSQREHGDGFVIGACFMIRRVAFEQLGGFDTRYWLYGEEADLCRRALDSGWRVAVVDGAEAVHAGGASGQEQPELAIDHFERGGERFVRDREGRRRLMSYRLANLVGASIRALTPGSSERRARHRARLRRLVSRLLTHPTEVALDSPATDASAHTLVVCSLEAWDDVWRRNQFLVREQLDADPNLRVLFVEPPFDLLHQLVGGQGPTRYRGLRSIRPDGRLLTLQPAKLAPRAFGPFADRWLHSQVRRAASRLGFHRPMLWVNDPRHAGLLSATGWPSLYDITDDWLRSSENSRTLRRLEADERELLLNAGAVVVCSPELAATRRPQRPDVVTISNAVDVDLFTHLQPPPVDLPQSPVAVYVGTLHDDRLDVDLVVRLSAALPELAIVLVGPDALSVDSSRALDALPNVHVLGPRPYADVPGYLQHADVIVVPHRVTPFTQSLDPIKAYECLAVGRPTVATPVAGFRGLGPPIRAVAPDRFVDEVASILAALPPPCPQTVPSWTDRARAFADVLHSVRARTRPLRVVFIDHCAQLSGGELALLRLLPALEGVEAHVILGEHGPLEEKLADAGAAVEVLELDEAVRATRRSDVRLGRLGLRKVIATARHIAVLRRRLRVLEPDLVHTNSLKAALYGGLAARFARVPVVWHVRDRIASDYLPRGATGLLHGLAFVIPRAVIFNSQATRGTLGNLRRIKVIPSPVIYDSVAQGRHHPPSKSKQAALRIAMVGRLAPWKGQHVFLEAFAKAFPAGGARAVIAGTAMFGEDDYGAHLRELADRLGVTERVEFAGFVDDIPGLLEEIDVVVHASVVPEPFGQVVLEGMAAGLPVVASAAGGPLELITHDVDGILVPPNDRDALADQLYRLAVDRALGTRLGRAASQRAQAFSPERVAALVKAVWATLRASP